LLTQVLYCLAVVRGVLHGIENGCAANELQSCAPSSNHQSLVGQQQQQQHLCSGYAAMLHRSGVLGTVLGVLSNALQAVTLCLGEYQLKHLMRPPPI